MSDSQSKPVEDMSFEQAINELETIVGKLEGGDVALEQSIAIYERGEVLRNHCAKLLSEAEARIAKVTLGSDGPKGIEPLDVD